MAASTAPLAIMGLIGAGNEWLHGHPDAAVKISVATMGAAVVFAGIEKIPGAEPFAVGLAVIALAGVVLGSFTPGVPSPLVQILDTLGYGTRKGR